jgi:2-polyprenyl-3-methyl-5-hydroxy-6-metoxy-1,4-benzoquinol methylase
MPSKMKNNLIKSGYTLDTERNIWVRPNFEGIDYSDGDATETEIADIIKQASDVSVASIELRQHCTNWPRTYHLHPNRSNLLRPIENYLKGDVLEIGCGCGAISRFLGENGANVLGLEGSIRRASIAESRTRDLDNVTVLSENFSDFKCDKKFDVVTFIGVLEYARKFSNDQTQDGIDLALQMAVSFLKPDGILIVAIENQLGLKYFAGFPEDHFGKPMYGIEGHYDNNSIVTFGRKDLGDRVTATGLSQHEWWFPFPDYKLPTLLVSEAGVMPLKGFDLATLTKSASSSDMQYPKYVNFMQERALYPVIKNSLLPELANSFLLVASSQREAKQQPLPLAIHFAADRKPEFTKKVIFDKNEKGNITAKLLPLNAHRQVEKNAPLKQVLSDAPYYNGEIWQDKLLNLVTKPGWNFQDIQHWFDCWFDAFCSHANIVNRSNLAEVMVVGSLFDAMPRNLIIDTHGVPVFIDQEWAYEADLEASYIIFRALLVSFTSLRYVALPDIDTDLNVLFLIKALMNSKGLTLDEGQQEKFIQQELTLAVLSKGYANHTHEELMNWLEVIELFVLDTHIGLSKIIEEGDTQITNLNKTMAVRDNDISNLWLAVAERDGQIANLNQVVAERDRQITNLDRRITNLVDEQQRILASISWKITRPLRFIRGFLR